MTMTDERRSTRKVRRCADSGGKRMNGKICLSHLNLSAINGRCPFHDPLRPPAGKRPVATEGAA